MKRVFLGQVPLPDIFCWNVHADAHSLHIGIEVL